MSLLDSASAVAAAAAAAAWIFPHPSSITVKDSLDSLSGVHRSATSALTDICPADLCPCMVIISIDVKKNVITFLIWSRF